jgi:YVTN family beta-propeller protein
MRYVKIILIILASVALAACGSGGGGGGGLSSSSGSNGTSQVTIAIGDVSAVSGGAVSSQGFTDQIPPGVEEIEILISSGGSTIIDDRVNVAGQSGFVRTYDVPNGTILFRAFAFNGNGQTLYFGSITEQINGPQTVTIDMSPGMYSIFVSNADSSFSVINPVTFDVLTFDCSSLGNINCVEPRNIAAAHNGYDLFIPFRHSNNVIRADATLPGFTSEVADNSFDEPYAAAFTGDNSEVWVVNKDGDSISIIDTSTDEVVDTISPFCLDSPEGIAIANGKAYVANRGPGSVCVIDVASRSVVTTLPTGGEPLFAVATPDEQFVYVSTNSSNPGIVKIRTSVDNLMTAIPVGGRNLAVSPDGSKVYVGTQGSSIGVIDVATDTSTSINVPGAYSIYAVAIDSLTGLGFATDEDRDVVYVFRPDNNMLLTSIPVGSTPRAIASVPGL